MPPLSLGTWRNLSPAARLRSFFAVRHAPPVDAAATSGV